ncbi:MAG: PPC domain-containing protein [Deltaproteobacteria bacterium]|nr:PPC domain-containing protein [Deltaproteobacteria bacterium]
METKKEQKERGNYTSWLRSSLLGPIVLFFVSGCGCDSDSAEARITLDKPADAELTYEDDEEPDQPGFQYSVVGTTENLDLETAIELWIDGENFDTPVVSYPDEDETLVFKNVTLPDGTHELKAGSPIGRVYSDPVTYTLYNLVIDTPENKETLTEDIDSSEEGLQSEVVVKAYGFEAKQEVVLTATDESGKSEDYTEETGKPDENGASSVTFDSVTFAPGEVELVATAEFKKNKTVTSSKRTVKVPTCPSMEFVYPVAPSSGQLTLYAESDTIRSDGLCGDRFGIDVAVSTDAEEGTQVELAVTRAGSTSPAYTDTQPVRGLRAVFEDVVLEDGSVANRISATVTTASGLRCSADFPADILVDCSGETGECPAGTHEEDGFCVRDERCAVDGSSCNNHGQCDDADGVVTCSNCDEGYTGAYCDECDTSADDPCGDHGQCNDDNRSAMCVCDNGYAGDDCSDCAPGFHADGSGSCVLDSQCLSTSCNGHGDCSVVSGVVTCSNCDAGYEGTFCQLCDDEATDPCGDHGSCDDSSGTAVCDCDTGYAGADCDECASGFNNNGTTDDPECDVSCSLANLNCGTGVCDDDGGPAYCDCEGTGYEGASCNVCLDDAFENNDSDTSARALPSTELFTGDGALCGFDDDWFSFSASALATVEINLYFIHSNGDLDLELWYEYSDPSGTRLVAYSVSFNNDENILYRVPEGKSGLYLIRVSPVAFTATKRNTYSLFVDVRPGGTCVPNETCSPNPCQHGGTCSADSNGDGMVECSCSAAYMGDKCESCAPGYHDESGTCIADTTCLANTCNGGSCVGTPPACTCNAGHLGSHCEICDTGYYKTITGTCSPIQSCTGVTCGGHGTCDNTSGPAICDCILGYKGESCSECSAGYHDENGVCVKDTVCVSTSCDRHGSCDIGSTFSSCECDQGYSGNCDSCANGYHFSCHTCQSLGVQCGTWDDGCGGEIDCGSCPSGSACHEYYGICADDVCDFFDTGCCSGNILYYCSNNVAKSANCEVWGAICGWYEYIGSKAGGFFSCLIPDPVPPPPPDGIQMECSPEWTF